MLTIGKLATIGDVSPDTLRFYERNGLIAPSRKSANGYRIYDENAIARLQFIKHARDCGFTLAEIQQLLVLRRKGEACCGDVRKRAIQKRLQLESKIRTLSAMAKTLDNFIADCTDEDSPIVNCPILAALQHTIPATAPDEKCQD
ncbi:heavy metal-responsive transcriptional regulator [Pollutimonas sp. H1-120]|uniref:heavy metal-responsive transcriptional regulator n=1 Tax=Pollutimonas sp. H1-120 TaxID=3148824 RepID=UPI003B515F48